MLGIRCVGVCGCQSDNPFVCFGAKPTQRAFAWDLPRDRKKTREGRSQRRGKGSRHEKSVKRRTQSAEGGRKDQSTEQVSQEMRVGQRGDQSTEVRKAAARTCWPTDAGLSDESAFLVALWKFRTDTRPRSPANARRAAQKCHRLPPSCAWR